MYSYEILWSSNGMKLSFGSFYLTVVQLNILSAMTTWWNSALLSISNNFIFFKLKFQKHSYYCIPILFVLFSKQQLWLIFTKLFKMPLFCDFLPQLFLKVDQLFMSYSLKFYHYIAFKIFLSLRSKKWIYIKPFIAHNF